MADTTAIRPETFSDIVSIVANRAKIAGTIQDRDLNFIKGAVNEWNETISTERNWYWRKFDRDFIFDAPLTTGTVSVTADSRTATFTGLTVDKTYLGRSLNIIGTGELYRIIGLKISTNTVYLAANYVGTTNATATFKLFQYEFPLPPDCDTIMQVYFDSSTDYYGYRTPDIDPVNSLEFNRYLGRGVSYSGVPYCYTREGKISAETLPPLDVMVLNYDFLGGNEYDMIDRIRLFPIQPDKKRLIHLNYSKHVKPMVADTDTPLMPIDNRWVIVHFALGEWWSSNGNTTMAGTEYGKAKAMLKEMRSEHQKTDANPKFIMDKGRFRRRNYFNEYKDLFLISRDLENS